MSQNRIFGLLLGRATSEQLFLSCLLGCLVGCVPWDHTGVALIALCGGLLLVLNASLPISSATVGAASLLTLVFQEHIDALGAKLLSGSLGGLLARISEAPLLAWADWESNRLTGGVALGLTLGAITGLLLVKAVNSLRSKLAELEEGSEAFKKWSSKPWVKLLAWALLGGLPKDGFRAALELKGRWWRPSGVAAAALLLIGGSVYLSIAQAKGVRSALVGGIAQMTGAQVDCASAELSFSSAQLSVSGLAIADPNDLTRDLVRWDSIEADLDALALSRNELVIERLVLTGAAFNQARSEEAQLIELQPLDGEARTKPSKGKVVDWRELIEDREQLEELLERVRRGFEMFSGGEGDESAQAQAQEIAGVLLPPPSAKTPLSRSRPRIHLVEASWRDIPFGDSRSAEVHLFDLTDEPDLIEGKPTTTLRTSDGEFELSWSRESENDMRFSGGGKGIDAARLAGDLGQQGKLKSGAIDLHLEGLVSNPRAQLAGVLSLQISGGRAELNGETVSLPDEEITLRLEGQLDDPLLVDRDGAWKSWLRSAVSGALLEKATGGGLGDLLRGIKR
ncbi:MAG: hypothetical protein OSB14_05335 [Planctomycetota bacterium]|nr:hypothetical protein [Planctomycetota bacterium]